MARQVTDGVWLLDLGFLPPLATNAYLVDDAHIAGAADGGTDGAGDDGPAGADEDGRAVTLVDAGLRWNRHSIESELAEAGYTPGDVDRVLLTHYDLDHTWGLDRIAGDLDGPVYVGAADGRMIAGEWNPDLFHHKGLFHRIVRRLFPLPDGVAVEHVGDGDRIGRFTAHHTPGHNPGHTVYVHDAGVAFLGDLVWEDDGEFTPPFWLDSYDMDRVRASIRRFAAREPAFEVACMGHGTPLESGGSAALQRLAARL